MDIWSHPNEPLVKHLLESIENVDFLTEGRHIPDIGIEYKTGNATRKCCQVSWCLGRTDVGIECETSNVTLLIARISAGLHDIGKATLYFQKYIRGNKKQSKSLTSHSAIGSLYTMWAILNTPEFDEMKYEDRLIIAFFAAIIVRTHHGNLNELKDERKKFKGNYLDLSNKKRPLSIQFQSISAADVDPIISQVGQKLGLTLPSWTAFRAANESQDSLQNEMKKHLRKIGKRFRGLSPDCKKDVEHPFGYRMTMILQFLFSLLQDADKTSAMKRSVIQRTRRKFLHSLEEYYQILCAKNKTESPTPIQAARPRIYTEAANHSKDTPMKRIYSLEAPTGAAKTMANLRWAFGIRQKRDEIFRIIYILPFTSIIEQVHKEIKEILRDPESVDLIKHHYLAELEYSGDSSEELSPNEKAFYIEGWNTEIVVSTFYQLFQTIFTNKKSMLRKYSKFSNCVIILDEIQAFPPKYWGLFSTFFPKFLDFMDSYAILSTATMPGIFDKPPESISEVGIQTFNSVDRTMLIYKDEAIEVDDLLDVLMSEDAFTCKSFLFVCNTIKSSQMIYQQVTERFPDARTFYLSASIIPRRRKEIIAEVAEALVSKDSQVFLVSTQVIEAGVDLSFERGFRDLAPLDSIVQSIGRVNRHSEYREDSPCWIIPLKDERRLLASYVYDHLLLMSTQEILGQYSEIREREFRNITKQYFESVRHRKNTASEDLIQAVCSGEFYTMSRDFKLIPDDIGKVPVYVEVDENARSLWNEYLSIRSIKDWLKRRDEYARIKPMMAEYIVNRYIIDCHDLEFHNWIYHLDLDILDAYYDTITGFIPRDQRGFKGVL